MTTTLRARTGAGLPGLADPDIFVDHALIGAAWAPPTGDAVVRVLNPATGETVGQAPDCGAAETRAAIEAAAKAFPAWRRMPARERSQILERWWRLVLDNVDDLARIMTAEQGKPLAEAAGEIRYAASFIKWFAEEGCRVAGRTAPAPTADRRILITKEPIGVAAAITPWNFPAAMITRKAAAALAAGCPMVVKPSELTPFTALALARLALLAGLPPGVLSVVTGRPEAIGGELTSNPTVRKLSFTGSTRVGALLMRQCADQIKKLSLELGGNAPFIIFDDADVDLAVEAVMVSKFRNAGQTCVCANRILVQAGIHDRFVAVLSKAVSALSMGEGTAEGVTIGPLINAAATAKVEAHLNDALAQGAQVAGVAGGGELDPTRFARPTVLVGATASMQVAREETFGPLAPVFAFKTEAEAVALANDTPYGLASYFYTNDLNRAWRVAEALEFGMVALNTGTIAMEMAPFGGVKQSGLGREGGVEGLEEYLEIKSFHWAGLKLALDQE
ncbi:NAD-dependent succinate-semialdehyde dehydrogenase [Phenylobacterium sp.]|uniref:NAD-dependent succinate-semialdehyde dehydrogenase n=1 Tax=Phenylobacterium sp. TaxID=1871053 RepID=UPI0035B47DE3